MVASSNLKSPSTLSDYLAGIALQLSVISTTHIKERFEIGLRFDYMVFTPLSHQQA